MSALALQHAPAPSCRFCGQALEFSVIDLGLSPLANSYLPATADARAREKRYPLEVRLCEGCLLAQVAESPPADAHFHDEYAYFSSYSAGWVAHAGRYAAAMIERFGLGPNSFVVEAASNDGYLLQHFVKAGIPALGVEPAGNCAAAAQAKGVESWVDFFNEATAARIVSERGPADLTAANNVLAHVPDISGFAAGFRTVLAADGVATFEFPHLLQLLALDQFDTIYHEHYSYLSLLALDRVFEATGLRVFDVEQLPTHGGSLRLFVCREEAGWRETEAVGRCRRAELDARLDDVRGYRRLSRRADDIRRAFQDYLRLARASGRRVAAYGAAAKGVTFLNYCGATADDIAFVVDRNPAKQGKLIPGAHIPICAPDALRAEKPDEIVILPWNLADEIAAEHAYVREWGGRFVVATPRLRFI
ncbi:MAG: class I SAM-dependent methyltransferase [Neomegalonema sp.]|nr:class I SAM-dependent methyltransferase [Neomegalonema sp.]